MRLLANIDLILNCENAKSGAKSENKPPDLCEKRRFRPARAFLQADQNLH